MNQSVSVNNKFPANSDAVLNNAIADSLAPLRFEGKASYNVPPEKLFAMVSEAGNMHKWLPMIKTIKMDHSHSEQKSQCSVGSVRQCSFSGMGDVDEGILWWNPSHSYGFSFSPKGRMKMMIPTTDHVIAFISESDGKGGQHLHVPGLLQLAWNFHAAHGGSHDADVIEQVAFQPAKRVGRCGRENAPDRISN